MPSVVVDGLASYPPALRALFDEDKIASLPEGPLRDAVEGFVNEYDSLIQSPDGYNKLSDIKYKDDSAFDTMTHLDDLSSAVSAQLTDPALDRLAASGVISDATTERATDINVRDNPLIVGAIKSMAERGSAMGTTQQEVTQSMDDATPASVSILHTGGFPSGPK